MLKTTHTFLLVIFFGLTSGLSALLEAREPGKPLQVVCTILPIYSLTLNVVERVQGVQVDLLLPAHQGCPHNYDLTQGDLLKLSRADLIIANGLGMEEFLDQFFKKIKLKIPILKAAAEVEPIANNSGPVRVRVGKKKGEVSQDHTAKVNGHAWVSPSAAAIMVRTIAEGLSVQDPTRATSYRTNAERYAGKLEGLSEKMKERVSKAKNKNILAFHDVLAYWARDIGLNIVGVVQGQLGIEPTSKDLARLVKVIKDRQVAAIFSEPQYSDKVVRTLSRETGTPFFAIDPVATGKPGADTYEKAMERNLETLKTALK